MAKITIDGISYEGTVEELKEIFEMVGVEFPEVKKTEEPLKVGNYAKLVSANYSTLRGFNKGDIVEIIVNPHGENDEDYKVRSVVSNHLGYVLKSGEYIISATDEEVVEAEAKSAESEKWAKIGRKPNEFKKGDIVKVKNPCGAPLNAGDLVEVKYNSKSAHSVNVTAKGWAVTISEIITPVEARFDA